MAADMNRRVFLTLVGPAAVVPPALALTAFGAVGCSKSFKCDGGLHPAHHETRAQFGYVDKGSDISRMCEDCSHFELGDTCGKCKVLPGPVHPLGTCTLFASR